MAKKSDLNIIPECYVDTNLISCLLGGIGVNHQKGCNQVTGVMERQRANNFAVGVIDADKVKPGYLSQFHEIAAKEHLSIMKHHSRPHFIITIHKAVEDFILDEAHKAGVKLAAFGLPDTLDVLRQQTKTVSSNEDKRFASLFCAISDKGEVAILKDLLLYLRQNTYATDEDKIKEIVNRSISNDER